MWLFSTPQQPQQWQQQRPQQLFPASYSTNWADLHPDSQKLLLQIEESIGRPRDESQRFDQCSRLFYSSDAFDIDAAGVVQELGGISTSIETQKAVLQEMMTVVKDMLRNTEVSVRSFMMLQPRFIHAKGRINSLGPVDFYSGLPKKPSVFMQQTVIRFEKCLGECRQWIEGLEQMIFSGPEQKYSNLNSQLQPLPKVLSNAYDVLIHVAAKVESIHHYIESMKATYLADQRRRGNGNKDPFLEADRRETARQQAAATRVHPTLHLLALPEPSTQTAGLFSGSGTLLGPSTTPPYTSENGFSVFGTPSTPSTPAASCGFGPYITPASAPVSSSTTPPATTRFVATSASPPATARPTSSGFGGVTTGDVDSPTARPTSQSLVSGASPPASATSGSVVSAASPQTPLPSGAAKRPGTSLGNHTRSGRRNKKW